MMLEKIGMKYYEKLSSPNFLFLEYIEKLKKNANKIAIAEIGVGIGATTQVALQLLRDNDLYYLFDYSDKVNKLHTELKCKYPNSSRIISLGNSRSAFDNYVWSLYKLSVNCDAIFDLVLLDGAHDYTIDLAACALIVGLLKPNGFLILDDIYLSVDTIIEHNSLKMHELKNLYSSLQASSFQIQMVCESFLNQHSGLQRITTIDNAQAIYRKKQRGE